MPAASKPALQPGQKCKKINSTNIDIHQDNNLCIVDKGIGPIKCPICGGHCYSYFVKWDDQNKRSEPISFINGHNITAIDIHK